MGSNIDLHGVYVPLITPFTSDDKPALGEIERLANEFLDAGAAGLVALGTTGEPATLGAQEKAAVVDVIGSACRQRSAHFVIGAGTNNTRDSIAAVEHASGEPGVTALLTVVPYYTRPSEAGIIEHFKILAAASAVPLIIYNVPYRTGRGLSAESLLQLADTPNIAGLKQCVGGIDVDTMRLMANKPDDFHVMTGDDPYILPLLSLGGSGAIAASAHVQTKHFVAMVDSGLKGDVAGARHYSNALLPLIEALFSEPNPCVIKGVLAAQGRITTPALRAPMLAASGASIDSALMAIQAMEQ